MLPLWVAEAESFKRKWMPGGRKKRLMLVFMIYGYFYDCCVVSGDEMLGMLYIYMVLHIT